MSTKLTAAEHEAQWWAQIRESATDLRNLIEDYHPASADFRVRSRHMPITAPGLRKRLRKRSLPGDWAAGAASPGPEMACETVRVAIAEEQCSLPAPVVRFDQALAANDAEAVCGLLSAAWFGVPESTDCWSIKGFGLSCDLMDDPPESVHGGE